MNPKPTSPAAPAGFAGGYSARRPEHSVVLFLCSAPQAKSVSVVGDFNDWHPATQPLQRTPDGCWTTRLALLHGSYRYLFLVDGKPVLDPRAQRVVRKPNEQYEAASLLAVS